MSFSGCGGLFVAVHGGLREAPGKIGGQPMVMVTKAGSGWRLMVPESLASRHIVALDL